MTKKYFAASEIDFPKEKTKSSQSKENQLKYMKQVVDAVYRGINKAVKHQETKADIKLVVSLPLLDLVIATKYHAKLISFPNRKIIENYFLYKGMHFYWYAEDFSYFRAMVRVDFSYEFVNALSDEEINDVKEFEQYLTKKS